MRGSHLPGAAKRSLSAGDIEEAYVTQCANYLCAEGSRIALADNSAAFENIGRVFVTLLTCIAEDLAPSSDCARCCPSGALAGAPRPAPHRAAKTPEERWGEGAMWRHPLHSLTSALGPQDSSSRVHYSCCGARIRQLSGGATVGAPMGRHYRPRSKTPYRLAPMCYVLSRTERP